MGTLDKPCTTVSQP